MWRSRYRINPSHHVPALTGYGPKIGDIDSQRNMMSGNGLSAIRKLLIPHGSG
jgi:hypothetical protein